MMLGGAEVKGLSNSDETADMSLPRKAYELKPFMHWVKGGDNGLQYYDE